tara:strand:+ start:1048 stop:1251 length:204 start_codon:yes stop_codon:yes gene_type:complete
MNNNNVKNKINKRALLKLLIFITFLLKRKIKDNENKKIGIISEYNVIKFGFKWKRKLPIPIKNIRIG